MHAATPTSDHLLEKVEHRSSDAEVIVNDANRSLCGSS
jgi:hypothetical protein